MVSRQKLKIFNHRKCWWINPGIPLSMLNLVSILWDHHPVRRNRLEWACFSWINAPAIPPAPEHRYCKKKIKPSERDMLSNTTNLHHKGQILSLSLDGICGIWIAGQIFCPPGDWNAKPWLDSLPYTCTNKRSPHPNHANGREHYQPHGPDQNPPDNLKRKI